MMRRVIAGAWAIGLLTGLVAVATPRHADAAELQASGWWWRAQSGLAPLPPPAGTPEDGLMVGGAPDEFGPTAVAAVRYTLEPSERDPILVLSVADELNSASAEIIACRTASPWSTVRAGTWEERPKTACESGVVKGVAAEDGQTWTFQLASLVSSGSLDVALLPATSEGGSPAFQVSFEPLTRGSLRTTLDEAADSPVSEPATAEAALVPDVSALPDAASDLAGPAGTTRTPAGGDGALAPSVLPARGIAGATRGQSSLDEPEAAPALAVVLAAGLALGWLAWRRLPLPTAAGHADPTGEGELGGLGRFRRPRSGPEPRL